MKLLQVQRGHIVEAGRPIRLRGTCIGGWLNTENFMNGYPGADHVVRAAMAETLGPRKARFFFDRMIDYFLTEDDIAFIARQGANVVRLSLNYRHFEDDARPFRYAKEGFRRLDQAVGWCAKHGVYAILDLHAVQGHQNPEWHCDNAMGSTLFWQHPHFQDRFVALWEVIAERYAGQPAVAGYNLMNETLSGLVDGHTPFPYRPNWTLLNAINRRAVHAIRKRDPRHMVFIEGDYYSNLFSGLEPPFAENLVYSSHNYNPSTLGPGPYPGRIRRERWDHRKQVRLFETREGTQFTKKHQVPLWVGEFGAVFTGEAKEHPHRLAALDDQIGVFEAHGAHWTTWTYKDLGVMGWVTLDPRCEYFEVLARFKNKKRALATDSWASWMPLTPVRRRVRELARLSERVLKNPAVDSSLHDEFFARYALDWYLGKLLAPEYAKAFKGMSESRLDRLLQSFALKHCRPHQELLGVLRRHLQ